MSIVLVIIGLIVSGVVAAKDMMRAAKINNIVQKVQKYQVAITLFDNKYDYLPGDLPSASQYWPSCTDNGSNLCGGNGNRVISRAGDEDFRLWQHLGLSEMITEQYTGLKDVGQYFLLGENIPLVEVGSKDGCMHIVTSTFGSRTGLLLTMGTKGWAHCGGPLFSPHQALSIDKKLDNGSSGSGKVFILDGSGVWGECKTFGVLRLNVTNQVCNVKIWMDY